MQGVKIIGGHSYFHLCAFITMLWLAAEYGDTEIETNHSSSQELVSEVELFNDFHLVALNSEGEHSLSLEPGVTEVCSTH
jgi:hypothetical protein